tara:strand:- start:300 stop:524 length:225 start_codon:yes stop_codon:yes gene_type:complete
MRRIRHNNIPDYDSGMDLVEQLALGIVLLGQVFIIYLFFDMYEYTWWLGLGLSISITTALYFFIKYMVDYFHKV